MKKFVIAVTLLASIASLGDTDSGLSNQELPDNSKIFICKVSASSGQPVSLRKITQVKIVAENEQEAKVAAVKKVAIRIDNFARYENSDASLKIDGVKCLNFSDSWLKFTQTFTTEQIQLIRTRIFDHSINWERYTSH